MCFYRRQYIEFLDFAYPELDASTKPNYTGVEGFDRHLKVFVPFFATVHNAVYSLLVEVLERDSARCTYDICFSWSELPLTSSCLCYIDN